ncbi:MAG: sensor histidine kinase [Chloroflexi bacterium]|nr:sensor histidine kinase [Chloroflexota bacterium]
MISILREWFSVNRPLVYFVYGQVFFILGLAIALQSRRYSRLNLARSLTWLAGFGFLHGLNEWGDLFIPIQTQTMSEPIIEMLHSFQHILLAASFACLFQFGIELLRPFPARWRWLRLLPAMSFLAWLLGPFWIGLAITSDVGAWHDWVNGLARYFLCIPGGWLSAFGLWRQVKIQIKPLGLPQIGRNLNVAAGALAAYGVLGGLLVPELPFFPANIINENTFTAFFVAPHPVFRSIAGLVLTVAMIRALEVFDVETDRMIRQMEESQVIAIEREHIARDLHDGALQQVYAAGLLAQSLGRQAKGPLREGLDRLLLTINQAIDQLRAFLPHLQPDPQSVELVSALTPIIEEARRTTPIETFWETPSLPLLLPEQISHLVAFTRETLSNAIRHAQTSHIEIRLACVNGHLRLTVRDFGSGFSSSADPGYGLRNMRDRARLLGAELGIDSTPGKGTLVTLDLPVEEHGESHPPVDRG